MENELGYYQVKDVKFTNKIQAILHAQKSLDEITWNYHSDKFNQVKWNEEPLTDLDTLYRLRAQQIRSQYDYIIVMCSGGADSTNVIKSFLNNDIAVDEIIASAPISGLKNWNWDNKDTSVNNTISETKYALFPLLNDIASNHPKIKISINDYFEDIIKSKTDQWLYNCLDWINPVINVKGDLNKFTHIKDLAEQGKKIGIVWGLDKPILRYGTDGNIYSLISDLAVNNAVPPFNESYTNVDRVLFYWSPDLPELMIKQSHVVAKFANLKENHWILDAIKVLGKDNPLFVVPSAISNFNTKNDYQRGIVPALYPTTFDPNTFQCQKAKGSFMPLQHNWFYTLHKDTSIFQLFDSDFKLFYKNINPKYLNPAKNGFKSYIQKYNIGPIASFMDK